MSYVTFGRILREERRKKGLTLRRVASDLAVTYGFISRLEANDVGPSEGFVHRVADYFGYDNDLLLLAAGKVPAEILKILREHPEEALALLRHKFGGRRSDAC